MQVQGLDLDSIDIFFIACSSRIIAALILTLKKYCIQVLFIQIIEFFWSAP